MTNIEESIIKEFEVLWRSPDNTYADLEQFILSALAQQRAELVKEVMDTTIEHMQAIKTDSWEWDHGDSEIPEIKQRILASLTLSPSTPGTEKDLPDVMCHTCGHADSMHGDNGICYSCKPLGEKCQPEKKGDTT